MRRTLIAVLLGIALQGVGGVALIAWWTRQEPAPGAPAAAPAVHEHVVAAAPQPSLGLTSMADAEAPRPAAAPVAQVEVVRAVRGLPPRAGGPARRRDAPMSFRREMKAGLAALERRVAECAANDASFTLVLETVERGVRVVEASLESRGSADDDSVACARSALLGETIRAPSAQPGRRWQISFAPGAM